MAARSHHIERRNPRRSPYKNNQGVCGVCGENAYKFNLIPQRGTLVDRTHTGCYDDSVVYRGTLLRGPNYGTPGPPRLLVQPLDPS